MGTADTTRPPYRAAYATLLTGDGYLPGALTLAASLGGLAWVVQDHADSVIVLIRDAVAFNRLPP